MYEYLTAQNPLSNLQSDFRPLHSTLTALLDATQWRRQGGARGGSRPPQYSPEWVFGFVQIRCRRGGGGGGAMCKYLVVKCTVACNG